MHSDRSFTLKPLPALLAVLLLTPLAAQADSTTSLGTVQAEAGGSGNGAVSAATQQSAPYQALTQGSLTATQPQSIISQNYIDENAAPTANYTDIINIAPSVFSITPNGAGGMETHTTSIRGLQDGQFNVTFDGIPFGDSNDFTHHSTSYFMPQDIRSIVVDRGPGTASTIGPATFGGTVAIYTRNPSETAGLTAYGSLGSFGTHLEGARFDTGVMQNWGGASAVIDYKRFNTDGYLTDARLKRQNVYFKLLKPLGSDTVLSLVAMYNTLHQNVSPGATLAQIQQYGPTFGLNNGPTSQAFYGYNYDNIETDFEYIGLKHQGDGWTLDNKLYTYDYTHHGWNGFDPNGETPNGTVLGSPGGLSMPNDVPGERMLMAYRSIGDILKLTNDLGPGMLGYGAWYDHQGNNRNQYEIDMSQGGAFNYNVITTGPNAPLEAANANPPGTYIDRLMYDSLDSFQPYVQYAWKITPSLTLTPGVKYAWFRRTLDAVQNQGQVQGALNYSKSWGKALGSVDLHYLIQKNWSAYVQVAQGFLAPNLNVFYVANPADNSVNPETTMNYQVGTTWRSHDLALSGDVYYIDFNNLALKVKGPVGQNIWINDGGAIYKGVEGEGTYYVGGGISVYANGSINRAYDKQTGLTLPEAPNATAAAGLMYNSGPWYASLITKYIGKRYGNPGESDPLPAFALTDLNVSYGLHDLPYWVKRGKVSLQVHNLFDKTGIADLAGSTQYASTNLYYTIPGRAEMVNVSLGF